LRADAFDRGKVGRVRFSTAERLPNRRISRWAIDWCLARDRLEQQQFQNLMVSNASSPSAETAPATAPDDLDATLPPLEAIRYRSVMC